MSNPYTPGIAGSPPVLAGRDEELREIEQLTIDLAAGRRIHQETILYGPRGNGKTTLLHRVTEDLERSSKVKPVFVQAPVIRTPEQLYWKLLSKSSPTQQTETTRLKGDLGAFGTSLGGAIETAEVTYTTSGEHEERCIAAMNDEPTLLMVDEAQRIQSETLDAILSITDAARRGKTKFAVILAGTPTLPSHIRGMDVSYLNRAPRRRIERFDVTSSEIALFQPMENAGYDIQLNKTERDRLIEWTQYYPHFIQCIGYAIWDIVERAGRREIDFETVLEAKSSWEEEINVMYEDRFQELDAMGLVPYATAVASACVGPKSGSSGLIDVQDIRTVILGVNADAPAHEVVIELASLGYVWPAKGAGHLYEPCIPSLMDHLLGIARDRETD